VNKAREIGILLALALVLAGVPGRSAVASAAASRCLPGHPYLLAENRRAQVFTEGPPGEASPQVYACAYGRRRTYRLGAEISDQAWEDSLLVPESSFNPYQLAGSTLAYETEAPYRNAAGDEAVAWTIVVRDLLSGRVLRRSPTGPSPGPGVVGGANVAEEMVVKPDGAVAWIVAGRENVAGRYPWEIWAYDRTGRRMLAAGIDVDSTSLTLIGGTLFWTRGGHVGAARLR